MVHGSLVAYPHSPRVSADSDGGRYAEGRHLVEQFAANFCLGPLIRQSRGAKSPAGLGATHVAARSAAHHLSRRARMRSHSAALLPRPVSIPSSRRTWANFAGSAKRLSAIICRKAAIPAPVKNNRGMLDDRSMRINPRSTRVLAGGGSFGWPFCVV